MTRAELIDLVGRIMDPNSTHSEQALDDLVALLKDNVTDPNVTDYIYWEDNTPEQVVDKALAYKPTQLPPPAGKS